jgi:2-iminoacetate synthase ThiH
VTEGAHMDAGLKRELEAKVDAGERLSRADGIALHESDDLAWLGRLAHQKRTEKHGDRVTFSVNPGPGESDAEVTVTYGDAEDLVDRLLAIRGQGKTVLVLEREEPAMPAVTLKAFAVARLLVDDIPHLRCSLDTHGQSVAQLTLNFGVDDLGTSAAEPEISNDDLIHLIWDAAFQPIERDDRFEVVEEHEKATPFAERRSEPQRVWA